MNSERLELNKAQKEAVEFGPGPVMVVAGAGTGKTRVITERIRYLIEKQLAKPAEILALTYTEKASAEMLNRLDEVLPLGYEEPWVSTFHAFGERILRSEALEIGLDPAYKIMTSPESWFFFRQHLFEFNLKYYRPLGNPGKFVSAILKLFSRAKDENITPEEFLAWALSMDGERRTDDRGQRGEDGGPLGDGRFEKEKWVELAEAFAKYEALKIKESRLDFGDLIIWTHKLFQERPAIRHKYLKQFRYLLIDEFQDTNYTQYQLIKSLAPAAASPNLMVCADDDQAIYKFRGASVANVLAFKNDYPGSELITLSENYRSVQPILDASYRLIQNNNPDRLEVKLGINKQLRSQIKPVASRPAIELKVTESVEAEAETVVGKIVELIEKPGAERSWQDFAILARANSHLEPFVTELKLADIPYQLVGNRGLYDQEEVKTLIAALKVIAGKKDDTAFYQLVSYRGLGLRPEIVSRIMAKSYRERRTLEEVAREANDSADRDEALVFLLKIIDELRLSAGQKSVGRVFYEFASRSKILSGLLEEETVANQLKIQNINLFFEKIKHFEAETVSPTVFEFLDYLEILLEAGENPAQAEIEDVDTVRLLTVHAAKGLEFPIVFLVSLTADRFPTRERGDPIPLPEGLVKEGLPEGNPHLEEERRLFYVAATRAKERLFLSYARRYGGVREKHPSGFIVELGLKVPAMEKTIGGRKAALNFFASTPLSGGKLTENKEVVVDLKSVSYSQLETFSQCPLKYKYRYILGLSGEPSHTLSFGQTIHRTLRDYHRGELTQKESPPLAVLLSYYGKNFLGEGYESREHRELRFAEGQEILNRYYAKHKTILGQPVFLEQRFKIRLGDIVLVGSIDRIDQLSDGSYEIIDYKTGEEREPKEVDKDEQLSIYALAAREDLKIEPEKLSLYFIEANLKVTTRRTPEQLAKKREELLQKIEEIKQSAFPAKVSLLCRYCEFRALCPAYKLSLNL